MLDKEKENNPDFNGGIDPNDPLKESADLELKSEEKEFAEIESSDEGIDTVDNFVVKSVKKILTDSVDKRASDIFVEPLEDCIRVRYRVDGLLIDAGQYPIDNLSGFVSRLKVLANLDIAEHRFPQDGRFRIRYKERFVDFRTSTLPSSLGEKVVLRVLDKGSVKIDLDSLGFDQASLDKIKRNLKKPYGMILVCGPTGSGKTTTLYSCLQAIDSPDINVVTVEDPIEYQFFGVNQVAVKERIGLTFASVLRSILRQDPDVIMIGEIRDFETADIAVKASLTGHLVLSTLHTTTATGAIVRFINMGIEPFLVASSCLVAASQILLRKLCSHCKEQSEVSDSLKKELERNNMSVTAKSKIYKPVGCRFCNNTGYSGRVGIIETVEITPAIRELLVKKATEKELRKLAISEGMRRLREKALDRVLSGDTTIEEVVRTTSKD